MYIISSHQKVDSTAYTSQQRMRRRGSSQFHRPAFCAGEKLSRCEKKPGHLLACSLRVPPQKVTYRLLCLPVREHTTPHHHTLRASYTLTLYCARQFTLAHREKEKSNISRRAIWNLSKVMTKGPGRQMRHDITLRLRLLSRGP